VVSKFSAQINLFDGGTATKERVCFYDLHGGKNRAVFSAMTPKAMLYFSERYGIPIVSDPESLGDYRVVLFSLHCFRDFYLVSDLAAKKRSGQEWIAGGNACATPNSVLWIMDHVWVGDCLRSFPLILAGERDLPSMAHASSPSAPVEYADEDISDELLQFNTAEVEMSKGCPRRCLFCIHPWRHHYQEAEKEQVVDYLLKTPRKGVGLMSNSSDDVSFYGEVAALLHKLGKTDMIVSNAVQGLTREVLATRKREVLLGIEGMSERLRFVVNKPIRQAALRERVGWCLDAGVQVRTVYQFNLPGEDESDFDELREDVAYLNERHRKGSWSLPFIPHHPSAHTPMQWSVPSYDIKQYRRLQAWRETLFGSRNSGIAMYSPQPLGPGKWFSQVVAEWLPITPKVSAAMRKVPNNLGLPDMVEKLRKGGVELPNDFWNRDNETVFPWSNVRTEGDDSNKWKRYERMVAVLSGPRFVRVS
jgi:radical SAM superfamily enzyme YgiQ (UPF0313 family)